MVALALTAAVGCVEAAPVGHVYGERGAALSFGAPTAEKNGELGFESLRRLIEAEGLTSIDDLVGRLPAALRSRYVLMHESRSLQEATYSAPRALLFTADASFVVAFNGGPTENGYLALETLEFDQKNAVFQLREVAFPAAGDARANVVFSEINPPRCLVCHGDAPRPIWDAYPEWPGAYGEVDHGALQGTEKTGIHAFLAARRSNPRYGPLLHPESFAESPRSASAAAYEGAERRSRNADFGDKLQRLEYRVIARRVTASPGFSSFRYALLAALDPQCPDIDSFVPEPVRSRFSRSLGQFKGETALANSEQDAAIGRRLSKADRAAPVTVETLVSFRYIAEEGLHLPTQGWGLALEPNASNFTTGGTSAGYLERDLFDAVLRDDSDLRGLRAAPERREGYCAAMRRISLAALSRLSPGQSQVPP
jgi:hypothetical protein